MVIRNDLSEAQKAVQACHAVWETADRRGKHPNIICVVVKSEAKLLKTARELAENKVKFRTFHEPDAPQNGKATAICTQPLVGKQRQILQRYKLL